MNENQINISAAVIVDPDGRTLLVRKFGTAFFMQPGGKIAEGEGPQEALIRELEEELGLKICSSALKPLGKFEAVAANEHNHHLVAELFLLNQDFPPKPASEIAEAIWIDPEAARAKRLAPLTRDYVMPILDSLGTNA